MTALAAARGRRRWVLLAALLGMVLTGRLGWWQLERAVQKQALHDAMAAQRGAAPLGVAQLARSPEAAERQVHQPVRLAGEWLASATLYLDNRQMGGRPGFFVLTPLRLATGDAVVVQRGWIPRDMQERHLLPTVVTPAGPVEVQGRVAPWPSRLSQLGEDEPGPIRQNVAQDAYAAEAGVALRPFSVVQLDDAGAPRPDGLLRDWPQPELKVAMHQGYAAQWFALCALIAGLTVWFQIIRPSRGADA
jgi:surfeit locus 1 family protein